jgi:hypothetical protein
MQVLGVLSAKEAGELSMLNLKCDAQAMLAQTTEALATAGQLRSSKPFGDVGHLAAFICSAKARDLAAGQIALRTARPSLKDEWMAHIAAFLLGEVGEADLLRLDASVSPAVAPVRRCEAGYYAGMAALYPAAGTPDPARALAHFRSSVRGRGCDEKTMSSVELYRLEHPVQ